MDLQRQQECIEQGMNWWVNLGDEEMHGFIEARKQAWANMSGENRNRILDILGVGREVANQKKQI